LKLNGTHRLLVYAYDVNTPKGSVYNIKETAYHIIVAVRETGLEVNGDKTKWSCLDSRMLYEFTVSRLILQLFKWWKSSNIWEQH
jgi:hypothetical protein